MLQRQQREIEYDLTRQAEDRFRGDLVTWPIEMPLGGGEDRKPVYILYLEQ